MASNASDSNDDKFSLNQANAKWPDLYSLLQVAPDADVETLRRRIREAYTEATNNTDHRNIERRIHYQTMSERIIPQARRILLDPNVRARYDRELALQKAGDPKARDYTTFLSNIYAAPEDEEEERGETIPGKFSEYAQDLSVASPTPVSPAEARSRRERPAAVSPPQAAATPSRSGTPDAAAAQANSADLVAAEGIAGEAIAGEAIAGDAIAGEGIAGEAVAGESIAAEGFATASTPGDASQDWETDGLPSMPEPEREPAPLQPQSADRSEPSPPAETVTAAGSASTSPAAPEAEEGQADALYASVIRPEGPDVGAHTTARLNTEEASSEFRAKRGQERVGRISLGENELSRRAAGGPASRGKRVMGQTTQMLATGVCAALLTIYILRPGQDVPLPRTVPLGIAYASDMQGFMEAAEREFEASPAGETINVDPRPMDSRAAMTQVLSGGTPVDLWIPAESLWSDRFNEVAYSRGARPISLARSVALSPCVLVARADRAAVLHQKFPNGVVTSWETLRGLVRGPGAGHFGLTDPTVSGAGAIARYFMAGEWARRNRTALNKGTVNSAALWQWLAGFEDNVSGSAKLTGDMVKDLALGTADRYWWAIAYESDAISWISKGKKLDVFYLPQTNYADHPLCYIDRKGVSGAATQARAAFEQFVRSEPMQKALLQNGLRPTEIELTTPVANNPFTDAKFRERGIRKSGFPAAARINYSVLNALNAAWDKRYGN